MKTTSSHGYKAASITSAISHPLEHSQNLFHIQRFRNPLHPAMDRERYSRQSIFENEKKGTGSEPNLKTRKV
jgi:hypothetical protein